MIKKAIVLTLITAIISFIPIQVNATCNTGSFLDPTADICWQCIYPITLAGVTLMDGPYDNNVPTLASSAICSCPMPPPIFSRTGISLSLWEPARYIETVRDAYCFPSLGAQLESSSLFYNGSTNATPSDSAESVTNLAFMQAHFFIYDVWSLLEIITDLACLEMSGFDVAYMTEVDAEWNNDLLSFVTTPESLLFANTVAQMACMADAVGTAAGFSVSPLFWCNASGGSIYPLTGNVPNNNVLQAHETAAARMQYMMLRHLTECDTGLSLCACIPTPIWVKHNYRIQLAKPVRDYTCHPFGTSDLVWGSMKDVPTISQEDFVWMMFRRRTCCVF